MTGATLAGPSYAASVPEALSLGGQLYDSSGTLINSSSVNFRIEVLDAAATCVLYRENHLNENLGNTRGRFNLILGQGTTKVNNVDVSAQLTSSIFANGGVTPVANCGVPSVALNAGDARQIRISYDLGSGFVAMTPNVPLVSSAYALIADTLQGKGAADFLQIADNGSSSLTQANGEYAFSSVNWPRLKALLDGSSSQYLPTTPTLPLNFNNQRVTNVADPVNPQDVVTKHYADTNFAGQPVDVSAVGPMTGNGRVMAWDATANKWVASVLSTAPTGAAGGDLAGTYPNPTVKDDAITARKIASSGGGTNRLLITDAVTGATVGYGACATNEVYAWTATGWACTAVSTLVPVTSVAGKTGAVVLNAADINGLGTAALKDYGTAAGQLPVLDASARLPAVDGSLLTNVNAVQLQSRAIATTAPLTGQVLGWNGSAWTPVNGSVGSVTNVETGLGLLGGPVTSTGTISVDAGTTANKILQLNASAQIPTVDGSLLFNVNASKIATRTVASTAPAAGQVLGWNVTSTQWEPVSAATGSVQNVASGTGLLGGPITSNGTLSVDVGTAGNQILQLNASAQIPAVNGSLLTGVNAVKLQTRDVAATAPTAGQVLGWNASTAQWEPTLATAGSVTNIQTANGILGGPITSTGTISVDTGTIANKILQLNASAQIPAVDASLLFNVNASKIATRPVAATAPTAGQVLGWNVTTTQWEPITAATGSVQNVASGTGLLGGPITTNGTLSVDVGTAANKILQLNASAQVPAVDGSLLTGVNAVKLQTRSVAATAPTAGQLLGWNVTTSQWEPTSGNAGSVTDIQTANGILGGPITSSGTISVDTGTIANKILQLNASAQIPAVDASLLFNVNASKIATRTVALTAPTAGQVLGWNVTTTQWEPVSAATGSVQNVASGVGLLGGPITSNGTLSVDVGTAANKILQLNASAQIPAVDGSLLTGVNAVKLQTRSVAATAPTTGQVLGWNTSASQWEPTTASTGTLTNVATGTGLLGGPITSTGTLTVDVGTAANKILQLNASAQIPAVDGSLLYNVKLGTRTVATTAPTANQVVAWNATTTQWEPMTAATGSVQNVASGTGLLGGPITTNGTLSVDVGTAANQILQLNASAQIPAVDGSLLTNVNASKIATRTVATTAPTSNQVIAWNATTTQWEPMTAATGSVQNVASGTGLLGGPITTNGTLSVDVGTAANKILQLNASAQIPAVDGSLLTGVNAVKLQTRTVAATAPTAGQVLGWNMSAAQWEPVSGTAGAVTNIVTSTGLLGGPITSTGTLSVDVGSAAGKIVQENANAQIAQTSGAVATPSYSFVGNTSTGAYSPAANQYAIATNGTAALTILANGNVGVGETAPGMPIAIARDLTASAGLHHLGGFYRAGGNYSQIIAGYLADGTNDTAGYLYSAQNLVLMTGNGAGATEKFRVTAGGAVGIGTSAPLAGLDIATTGTIGSAVIVPRDSTANRPTAAVNGMLRYNNTINAMEGFINGVWSTLASGTSAGTVTNIATSTGLLGGPISSTGTLSVDVGSTAGKIVQENANAQIAQMAGSASLPAFSFAGSTNTGVFSPAASQLALATNGTAALTVLGNGMVGIGTTVPVQSLDVNGAARATSFIVAGAGTLANTSTNLSISTANGGDFIVANAGNTPQVIVKQSGLMGLGTTLPQAGLDIATTGTIASALIVPRDSTTNRPTSAVNGMLRYNNTLSAMEGFINGAWSALSTGTSAGTVTNVAGGVGLLGGPITSTGTLNVDVGSAANKVVQENANAQIAQTLGSSALPTYSFVGNTNTGWYSPGAGQLALSSNGTTSMNVAANGFVGLGTTTPLAPLHVSMGGNVTATFGNVDGFIVSRTGGAGDNANMYLLGGSGSSGASALYFGNAGTGTLGAIKYNVIGQTMSVVTNSATRMTIDGTGKVGIGTATPLAGLDVALTGTTASALIVPRDTTTNRPTAAVNGMLRYNNTLNVMEGFINGAWSTLSSGSSAGTVTNIATSTGLLGGPITTNGTLSVDVGTGANQIVQENASGQIAQSAGSAAAPAYAFVGNLTSGLFSPAAGQLSLASNGTAALSILANGNVGIGTTTPSYNLSLGGATSARTIGLEQNPAGAGSGLTISAGAATGTSLSGGPLVLSAGASTGFGGSTILFKAANPAQPGGTTAYAPSTVMTLTGQAYLGVGQPNPNYGIDVSNTGSLARFTNANTPGVGVESQVNLAALNSGYVNTSYGRIASGTTSITAGAENGYLALSTIRAGALTEGLRVTSAGNVGIGTNAPLAGLDVALTGTIASAIIVPRDSTTNRPTNAVNGMLRYNNTLNVMEGFINGAWSTLSAGSGAGTVTNIATSTGLLGGPITSNGTLSVDVGSAANKIVQENANAQIAQTLGTVALPAYSFAGNTNTGLYSPAANSVSLSANGTAALTVAPSGWIAIGTTIPQVGLHVASDMILTGSLAPATSSYNGLLLLNNQVDPGGLRLMAGDSLNLLVDTDNSGVGGLNIKKGSTNAGAGSSLLTVANNGNVGIGVATPQAGLDVALTGTIASAIIVPRDSTTNRPTAAVNGMLRYNNTLNVMEGFINGAWSTLSAGAGAGTVTNIATSTGLLGGPITSTGTLSVDVGSAANKIVQENANAQIAQMLGTAALPSYSFADSTNTGMYSPAAGQLNLSANGTAALTVSASGRIGIGTSNATSLLEVTRVQDATNGIAVYNQGATSGASAALFVVSDANSTGLYSYSSTFATNLGGLSTAGRTILRSTGASSTGLTLATAPSTPLILATNDTVRVQINGNGLMGIGTTTPLTGLDIATTGTIASAIILPRDSTANRPTNAVNGMIRYNSSTSKFEAFENSAWSNIIGGGSPSFPLLANPIGSAGAPAYSFSGNANTGLYSPGMNQVALSANGTAALTVLANGNVGIGSATPTTKLDVNGNVQAASITTTAAESRMGAGAFTDPASGFTYDLKLGGNNGGLAVRGISTFQSSIGIGTNAPQAALDVALTGTASSAIIVPRDTTANRPINAVNGMLRYNTALSAMEGFVNGAWSTFATGTASSGSASLSSLTAATATNTLANANFGQIWNWDTLTSQNGLQLASTSMTTGSILNLLNTNNSTSSNGNMINVTAAGASNSSAGLNITHSGSQGASTGARITMASSGTSDASTALQVTANGGAMIGANISLNNSTDGTTGKGLQITAAGGSNYGADINMTSTGAAQTATGLRIQNSVGGAGFGATIAMTNASATGKALQVSSTGSGDGVYSTTASGRAGYFSSSTGYGLIVNGGNVGIGTSVAPSLLTVGGNVSPGYVTGIQLASNLTGTGATMGIRWANSNTTIQNLYTGYTGGYYQGLSFQTDNNGVATSAMNIVGNGSVGIGTNAPQAGLDIATTGTVASAVIVPRDSTANRPSAPVNGMIRYNNTTSKFEAFENAAWTNIIGGGTPNFPLLASPVGTVGAPAYSFSGSAKTGMYSPGTNQIALSSNGTAALTINAAGNVGIGTASPGNRFEVYQGTTSDLVANFINTATSGSYMNLTTGGGFVGMNLATGTSSWSLGSNGVTALQFNDNTNSRVPFTIEQGASANALYIASTGRVGLGTTTPQTTLDVTGGVAAQTTYEGVVSAYVNSATAYTIPDTTLSVRRVTLTAASPTITLPAFTTPTGKMYTLTVFIKQDATGNRAVTFAGGGSDTIKWDSNVAPTIASAAGKITIIQLMKPSDETVWYGSMTWKEN